MITLAIDAATYTGTVALLDDAVVVAEHAVAMRGEREERLMPAVDAALREARVARGDIERIVCGAGPGSFTSLRIAASIAKGMAMGLDVPLYAVSSLWLIVAGASPALPAGRYVASLDAMRGERYVTAIDIEMSGAIIEQSSPTIERTDALAALAHGRHARTVGPGADIDLFPHARGAALLDWSARAPVALATWEPLYGRLAEAQVKWEAAHGRPLDVR